MADTRTIEIKHEDPELKAKFEKIFNDKEKFQELLALKDNDEIFAFLAKNGIEFDEAKKQQIIKDAAFGFLSRGFSVTIAEDCCAATSKQNRKLAAEELRAAGCTICSSESVIMELASGCTKQVLDAVREILFS
jgi:hypothetical protein